MITNRMICHLSGKRARIVVPPLKNLTMNDDSIMPYGKFKGCALEDVPAAYLIWMYANDKLSAALREYVDDNRDVIEKEARENPFYD